jgi:hypothetical protein
MNRVFFFTELQAKKAVSTPSHAPSTPQYLGLFSLWPNKARGKRLWDVQLENQRNSISPGTPEVTCAGPPSVELYRALETSANGNKYTTLAFTFRRCLHTLLISAYTFTKNKGCRTPILNPVHQFQPPHLSPLQVFRSHFKAVRFRAI